MFSKGQTHGHLLIFLRIALLSFFIFRAGSSLLVYAGPVNEVEPNNTSGTAQTLNSIGRENYVIATMNPANDRDWYKFTGTAGQTYVIELFEAGASLNAASGSNCAFDEGLGIKVYDASITQIAASCEPNDTLAGSGNVHNIVQFTTGVSGDFYLQVIPNSSSVTGDYKLRVLYQYNNVAASWDSDYEPNNQLMNAAPIQPGRLNAISTTIEQRIVNYATNFVDVDWYRFEVVAGKTYVIELFNADINFNAIGGYNCNGNGDEGIGLRIYDTSGTVINSSCEPNDLDTGAGNVHNIIQFTPGLAGTYFIKIIPNESTRYGSYQLRVLPQYDDPVASWDNDYEPNNRLMNAAPIQLGRLTAISTSIEQRITTYATDFVDTDWYRFDAEANKTYVIELFNADINFNAVGGYNCNGNGDEGIGMRIFDAVGTEIASSCEPNDFDTGAGNVHNIVQFTPGLAGTYFIKVIPNESARYGNYQFRVLPQYDDPIASWDSNNEPNNRLMNAAPIELGRLNAINTSIEQRIATYATDFVDVDWYRFNAEANKTYIIELLNADIHFNAAGGYNCIGNNGDEGIGMRVYDATSTVIISSCEPNDYGVGSGNVHNIIQFTPGLAGTYFIQVIPNESARYGNYQFRVLPPHDDPLASWDVNYEPNNKAPNGYLLFPGATLTTNIESRSNTYSTNFVDRDWYRLEAVAGQTYTIETVNVANNLATSSGTNCRGTTRTGLGIVVYDPTVSTRIAEQCSANGVGDVHTYVTFKADSSGTYYIWVIPNSGTAAGNYGVRLEGYKAYLPLLLR